jgi:hypothetical protein
VFTSVPEPAALALLVAATAGGAWTLRRRGRMSPGAARAND